MTDAAKIEMVKALSEETDESVISAFLELALDVVCNYADPFRTVTKDEIAEEYGDVQVNAAAYYLNKRGWDFQSAHSDNGISRTFEAGDLPPSITKRITPKCGVVS